MRLALLLIFASALLLSPLSVQSRIPTPPGIPTDALGIAMEGVPYPFLVQFLRVDIEGQPSRFAYMDVQPDKSNGQCVLLLHGKNFYGSYWENTVHALNAAGYRVIVPDQIGFGKSAKPITKYTFELLAEKTALLLDHLGLTQTALVGHSMGGMLAVRFTRDYPDRVTHLVLENPIGLEDYRLTIPPQSLQMLYNHELTQTSEDYRKFVAAYYAHPIAAIVEPFVDVRDRLTRSAEFPRWAQVAALTYQMIYQQPVVDEFPKINRPALLVIGQKDRTAVGKAYASPAVRETLGDYPALGKAAHAEIPGSLLIELEDVGHIPHLEAPDRFHAALLEFLAKK
jgi:pimeloyl-ACP methyl ester carboxylesterase